MRRREHSSLHLNGIQTEMRRSDVSKTNAHEDTCVDRVERKNEVYVSEISIKRRRHVGGILSVVMDDSEIFILDSIRFDLKKISISNYERFLPPIKDLSDACAQ